MKKLFITIFIALAALTCAAGNTTTAKQGTSAAVERVEKKQDPIVGTFKGHDVHQGPKGGLYWWHTPKTGKNAGKQVKRYLTKEEREQFNQNKTT